MYTLNKVIHQLMDTIRAKFFCQGADDKFKYHMMKWENLCLPKDFGGMGIMDTRSMNKVLLGKWAWRMLRANKDDLCYNLLKKEILEE